MPELNLWLGGGNLLCAVVFGALALPLMRGRVKPNEVYGFRLGPALQSEEAWYRWNRIGGRHLLKWAGVIAMLGTVCLWFPPLTGFWIWFFGLAPCLVGIAFWQTCREATRD